MGLDTSFRIIIDDNRHFIDFIDEKQKEKYRYFRENERCYKEKPLITDRQINMNYWYPDDLPYSHPKRH